MIGEFARSPRFQGAGSSKVNPTRVDDALTALRAGVGAGVTLDFAPGFGVDDPDVDDAALLAEAVETATGADTVVLFLGLPGELRVRGLRPRPPRPARRSSWRCSAAVAGVNDRVVVVLANGSVVGVADWEHHAGAILEGWLGGQAGGGAIADLLLGDANPSGRLTETVPLRLEDTPAYLNFPGDDRHVLYGEGVHVGYRHYDAVGRDVSYPFGHGLSYTTFEHSDLAVTVLEPGGEPASWLGAPRVSVSVTVTNTGNVAGQEVVQVYVGDPEAGVRRPVRELKAFAKVALDPGESQRVDLVLTERDLSYWSTRAGGWVLEPGTFEVAVGASSRDLRLTATVEVEGPRPTFPLDRNSTLAEWLDHPVGHEILIDSLRHSPLGDLTSLLDNPEQLRMIGSFPMSRLATMLGDAMGDDEVDALLAKVQG